MTLPSESLRSEVQDLVDDLTMEVDGYRLYYAVDQDQLKRYCFPVNPKDDPSKWNINEIADVQVGLDELFNGSLTSLILPQYEAEIEGLVHFLMQSIHEAYSSLKIAEAIANSAVDWTTNRNEPPKLNPLEIEKHFTLALALKKGLYAFGGERFVQAYQSMKGKSREATARTDLTLAEELSKGLDENLAEKLRLSLSRVSNYWRQAVFARPPQLWLDLATIAQLIELNQLLQNRVRAGDARAKFRFLYVSSNRRSQAILSVPEAQELLPVSDGRRISMLRTERHFLHYRVAMGRAEYKGDKATLLKTLESFLADLNIVTSLSESSNPANLRCDNCVLSDASIGTADVCGWANVCTRVKGLEVSMRSHRMGVQNRGLLAQITQIKSAADRGLTNEGHEIGTEGAPVINASTGSAKVSPRLTSFLTLFKDEVEKNQSEPRARENLSRLKELDYLFVVKRKFKKFLSDEFRTLPDGTFPRDSDEGGFLRKDRDVISSVVQYLPMYPKLDDQGGHYAPIIGNILEYFQAPPESLHFTKPKVELIQRAYQKFVELDLDKTTLSSNHELARCYLLMALPSVEGDKFAHDHAKRMLAFLRRRQQLEFLYILVWTSRRQLFVAEKRQVLFNEGLDWAEEALNINSDDPRFYHGRGLLHFSWAKSGEARDVEGHLNEAACDIQEALKLYTAKRVGRELVAICNKDLALFYSDPAAGSIANVGEALKALARLEQTIPEEDWYPLHPEFFHAKAQVLAHECNANGWWSRDDDATHGAIEALIHAEIAWFMYNKPSFQKTLDYITSRLRVISRPTIRILRQPQVDRSGAFDDLDEISGFIGGNDIKQEYSLVLYVLTDKWYRQWIGGLPKLDRCEPLWHVKQIHVGHRYAALMVLPTYDPPDSIENLPPIGGSVIAIDVKGPREK